MLEPDSPDTATPDAWRARTPEQATRRRLSPATPVTPPLPTCSPITQGKGVHKLSSTPSIVLSEESDSEDEEEITSVNFNVLSGLAQRVPPTQEEESERELSFTSL